MNTYKISFKGLRQNPSFSEMLEALERGFERFGLAFYLIGAVAQNAWLSAIHHETPGRATRDLDLAVLIPHRNSYRELREYLIGTEGFQPQGVNWHKLVWKDQSEVDLLPFGDIDDDVELSVGSEGYVATFFPGLKEIFSSGLPTINLEDKHKFKLCTIPGIILLKLLSWKDDPYNRGSDIEDICEMLQHYYYTHDEYIYDNHTDIFGEMDFDQIKFAARVIGREMASMVSSNSSVFNNVVDMLISNTDKVEHSKIGEIMAAHFDNSVEENIAILNQMKIGFTE